MTLAGFRVSPLQPFEAMIPSGQCVVVRGPSGSGKTRLLRGLADLIPWLGEMLLDGVSARDIPPTLWRRQVMLVPREPAWWEDRPIDHFPHPPGKEDLLALDLDSGLIEQPVSRLSTGQSQRLALARALAHGPRVLLLDEPTANLDAGSARAVEEHLAAWLREGERALVWVSHDSQQQQALADQLWTIEDGRVVISQQEQAQPG